jgi:hypothetical protein
MRAEFKNVGFNAIRLKKEDGGYFDKEINFVKAINEEMERSSTILAQIVGNPERKTWLDEHDNKVVLSVIQWLGTPVGQGFLDKVSKMPKP